MAARTDRTGFDSLFRSLVAYRLFIYVGGLIAISLPRVLRTAAGIELAAPVRTLVVVVSLGVMILTYVGERRVGLDGGSDPTAPRSPSDAGSEAGSGYSRRTRTSLVIGLAGIAIGVYVALEADTLVGVLFVIGGVLFGRSAYRGGTERS